MKYLILATGVVSSLAIFPVFASDSKLNTFYVSGDVGWANLATPHEALPNGGPFVTSSAYAQNKFGAGADIGYRRAINPLFSLGLEAGYDYNGQTKYQQIYSGQTSIGTEFSDSENYIITSQDLHVLATGMITFHSGFNIFGKGGVARVDQKLEANNSIPYAVVPVYFVDTHSVGYRPMAAVGVGYSFKNMDIFAQYSHIFGANASGFSDLVDSNGNMSIVSVEAVKLGLAVSIKV